MDRSMKIVCECGALIVDQSDCLPHKAHFIADQEWDGLFEAIDAVVQQAGLGANSDEAICMRVRELIGRASRPAWQCAACGRLYLDDLPELRPFVPASAAVPKDVFRVRRS